MESQISPTGHNSFTRKQRPSPVHYVHSVTTITVHFQPANISTHTQAPRTTFTPSHPAPPRTPKHSTRSPISCTGSTTDHHQHCQAHSYPAKPTHTLPCTLTPWHAHSYPLTALGPLSFFPNTENFLPLFLLEFLTPIQIALHKG